MIVEEAINRYIELRDAKSALKAEWSKANALIETEMNQIEAQFLQKFNEEGSETVGSASGTAYKSTRSTAKVLDRDSWLKHIIESEDYQFIESRVNKTAVDEYINEHGMPPPGVGIVAETTVNIRRS